MIPIFGKKLMFWDWSGQQQGKLCFGNHWLMKQRRAQSRFTPVSKTTINFSHNSILCDRQGKQIATLSAAAGWGAAGLDGLPWFPAIHSFIHSVTDCGVWGIKASTSLMLNPLWLINKCQAGAGQRGEAYGCVWVCACLPFLLKISGTLQEC